MSEITSIPLEILEQISQYLHIRDYHSFRLSFKSSLSIEYRVVGAMFVDSVQYVKRQGIKTCIPIQCLHYNKDTFLTLQECASSGLISPHEFDRALTTVVPMAHQKYDWFDLWSRGNSIKIAGQLGCVGGARVLLDDHYLNRDSPDYQDANVKSSWYLGFGLACKHGNREVVAMLIDEPIFTDRQVIHGYMDAIQFGQVSVVRLFLDHPRIDPNGYYDEESLYKDEYSVWTAATYNQFEILNMLVEDDRVDPSLMEQAALVKACYRCHLESMKILLKDPRVIPNRRAMHTFIRYGYMEAFVFSPFSRTIGYDGAIQALELLLEQKTVTWDLEELELLAADRPRLLAYLQQRRIGSALGGLEI
jgi:hypothetical protein